MWWLLILIPLSFSFPLLAVARVAGVADERITLMRARNNIYGGPERRREQCPVAVDRRRYQQPSPV